MTLPTQIIEYPLYNFAAGVNSSEPIHTFNIDEDGIVGGQQFETYYHPLEKVLDYGDFIGFICDDGGPGFIETRIPVSVLIGILNNQKAGQQ